MSADPTLTYQLDPTTYEVLSEALEQHAAHQELLTRQAQFAPTTEDRMALLHDVLHTEELRRTIEAAQDAGQVSIPLEPSTYRLLTEALSGYHDDQMHAAEEATQDHDDPEAGDPARQSAAAADRLHLQAVEAATCAHH